MESRIFGEFCHFVARGEGAFRATGRPVRKAMNTKLLYTSTWQNIVADNDCLVPNSPIELIHDRYSGILHKPLELN